MKTGFPAACVLSSLLFSTAAFGQSIVTLDVHPSGSSAPRYFADANGVLYFTATDGTHGRELWKTDGTPSGTTMVVDLEPGAVGSNPIQTMVTGHTLFCTATTTATGTELVAVNLATDTATVLDLNPGVASSDPGIIVFHLGRAYFAATTAAGRELWTSDGTVAGTEMVADLAAGPGDSSPDYFCPFDGKVYFQAKTPATGVELFVTDGTAAGTTLALDYRPGTASSNPTFLTVFRNELVFVADTATQGTELVVWDRTTARVLDVATGSASSGPRPGRSNNYPPGHGNRFATSDTLLYFRASQPATGIELFKFDGTAVSLVMDIWPGTKSSAPYDLTFLGDRLFFSANDGSTSIEPWVTSGTAATTRRVANLGAGGSSSNSENYTPIGSRRVIFESKVSQAGEEVVITDGTTVEVIDLWPGWTSSYAANLTPIAGAVYFNGVHPTLGDELHRIDTGAMTLPFGTGCTTTLQPRLTGTDPILGSPLTVELRGTRPSQTSMLCIGDRASSMTQADFGWGCYLYLDFSKRVFLIPMATDTSGGWSFQAGLANDPSAVGIRVGVMVAVPGDMARPPLAMDWSNLLMMTIGK